MLDKKKQFSEAMNFHHHFEGLTYMEFLRAKRVPPLLKFSEGTDSFQTYVKTKMVKTTGGKSKEVETEVPMVNIGIGFFETDNSNDLFWQIQYMLGHELQHARSTTGKDAEAVEKLCLTEACNKLAKMFMGKPSVRLSSESDYNTFFKELETYGIFTSVSSLRTFIHWIMNVVEDGRIENIRSKLLPGFMKYRKAFRGMTWLKNDARDEESGKMVVAAKLGGGKASDIVDMLPPSYRLTIILNDILSLSTCSIHQKGFLALYGETVLYDKVKDLIPYISKAVLAKKCKTGMEYGKIVFEKLFDDYIETCKDKEDSNKLSSSMNNSLSQTGNGQSSTYSAMPSNEEEGDGTPSESVFGTSDLETDMSEEEYEEMKKRMEEDGEDIESESNSVNVSKTSSPEEEFEETEDEFEESEEKEDSESEEEFEGSEAEENSSEDEAETVEKDFETEDESEQSEIEEDPVEKKDSEFEEEFEGSEAKENSSEDETETVEKDFETDDEFEQSEIEEDSEEKEDSESEEEFEGSEGEDNPEAVEEEFEEEPDQEESFEAEDDLSFEDFALEKAGNPDEDNEPWEASFEELAPKKEDWPEPEEVPELTGEKSSSSEGSYDKNEENTSRGHNNHDVSHDDTALSEDVIESLVKDAMEKAIKDSTLEVEAVQADIKRLEDVKNAAEAMKAVEPSAVDLSSLDNVYGDVKFYEAVRKYKPGLVLPFELDNKGRSLNNKVEEMIKNKKTPDLRGQKAGRIDATRLHALIHGDLTCHKKRGTYDKPDVAGYILIDNSGSMGNGPGSTRFHACNAAAVIEEGFKAHMPLKIAAFDARSSYNVTHEVIKEFDEICPCNLSFNFKHQGRDGYGNKDGYSIRVATRQLMARGEKDKILIVLSDGLPSDYAGGYTEGVKDVRQAVEEAKKAGIKVIGIYMYHYQSQEDFALYKRMYDQHIFSDMDGIEPALESIFKRMFR